MSKDSQKSFRHPQDELKEIEETLALSVELLHKGYEEGGEVKPWTHEAISHILETIIENLSKKQDIFEEIQEFEKAGGIADIVDSLVEINELVKTKNSSNRDLVKEITLLLQ